MLFAVNTDIGMTRSENQDSFGYIRDMENVPEIYVVADGMGGHKSGHVASKIAVDFVIEKLSDSKLWENGKNDVFDNIMDVMKAANDYIAELGSRKEEFEGMGTTMIITVYIENKLYIGHVGDSRLYIMNNKKISQITTDHSYVELLVKEGTISREDARNHPKKNIITRALGIPEKIAVDTLVMDLKENDTVIICTDGLSNKLEDKEMWEIIKGSNDLDSACRKLIDKANERGGEDNVTVILLKEKQLTKQ